MSYDDTNDELAPRRRATATTPLLAGGTVQPATSQFAGEHDEDVEEAPVCYDDPERALEELHERYAQKLMAYAQSILRSREDAEDAVQTAFMNAYNAIVEGRVPRQEASWLFRIVRNTALNRIRTHQRKPAGTLDGVEVASERTIDDALDQRLHSLALRAAIDRLPDQQRKAIVLRELQGASYAEIAEALGTTQGAVESLIFRARRHLASSMRAAGTTPGAVKGAAAA